MKGRVTARQQRACGDGASSGARQRAEEEYAQYIHDFIVVAVLPRLISCVNTIASAIYVSMNFVPLSKLLILVGQFCWLMAHGIPPFIYLLLNRTVRRDATIEPCATKGFQKC
ncbi:hypothetical protein GPALN_010106 [Globodera pallida]|nr:hypothetical protein GPALN_010106 [Globodera pallida]